MSDEFDDEGMSIALDSPLLLRLRLERALVLPRADESAL
jgi:hypothetical protein